MDLKKSTFDKIREIVYQRSGIALNKNKLALVSGRVGKRIRALGLTDYEHYLSYLARDRGGAELVQLLDVISTNVTHFFREAEHFDVLARAATEWARKGQNKFRFWSAACSTGQEPYAMAMTLLNIAGIKASDLKILATDISTQVLAQCKQGVYNKKSLKTVPLKYRRLYFNQHRNETATYEVKNSLKNLITFKRLNLAKPPFPMHGPFDAVFCCNVMIYFDNIVRNKLINEIYRLLKPGGYLIVGNAESLSGLDTDLKIVQPSVYIKQGSIL